MKYKITRLDSSSTKKEIIAAKVDASIEGFIAFCDKNNNIVSIINKSIIKEIDITED
jgi:hypothetical protein